VKTNYDKKVQPGRDWDKYGISVPSTIAKQDVKAVAVEIAAVLLRYGNDGWHVATDKEILKKHTSANEIWVEKIQAWEYWCGVPVEKWVEKKEIREAKEKTYKVIRHQDTGILESVSGHRYGRVNYQVGKFVTAPEENREIGHHLLAFNSLESATKFMKGGYCLELWECEVSEPLLPLFELPFGSFPWQNGTIHAEKVKLIKKLYS